MDDLQIFYICTTALTAGLCQYLWIRQKKLKQIIQEQNDIHRWREHLTSQQRSLFTKKFINIELKCGYQRDLITAMTKRLVKASDKEEELYADLAAKQDMLNQVRTENDALLLRITQHILTIKNQNEIIDEQLEIIREYENN